MGLGKNLKNVGPISFLLMNLLFISSCASVHFQRVPAPHEAPQIPTLKDLPYQELWSKILFHGEKVGFTRLKITAEEENFVIASETHIHLPSPEMDKNITTKSEDRVGPDLSLISSHFEQQIDKKSWIIEGKYEAGLFRAVYRSGEQANFMEIRFQGPIYPARAIHLYPVLKGLTVGSRHQFLVFDPQTQSFPEVIQRVTAFEESPKLKLEPAYRVETELLDQWVSTWINPKGEAIFELGMGGILMTFKEDPEVAKPFISEASLNKKDLLLDFSLVRTQNSLPCPREARLLKVALEGVLEEFPPLQGPGQEAVMEITGKRGLAVYHLFSDRTSPPTKAEPRLDPSTLSPYLAATPYLESNHPEIQKAAQEAVAGATSPLEQVRRLTRWVSSEVQDQFAEDFSAVEILRTRKGGSQAHTLLYAAMARALKIPTRIVGGLVYVEGAGFLYHSWAESYLDGWIAIDPTFNQVGVDATHIKLVEGPSWTSLFPLGKVVGKIRASILDYETTCGK